MTMIHVGTQSSIRQWIDGFVDDTSIFTNIVHNEIDDTLQTLCEQFNNDMITWKVLLEASGGKLELSKCFYYILSWKFDDDGNGIPMTITEQRHQGSNPIQITEQDKSTILIEQKEVFQSHKSLGCYKAIDGNEVDQIKFLKKQK
jgi:hypothetical protein